MVLLLASAAVALQLELVRHSLTGTHYRYRTWDGAQVNVSLAPEVQTENVFLAPVAHSIKQARVFVANPVKTLNDPSLQDQNNAANAVPDAAYSIVDLEDVNASGPLSGPYCQIVDTQPPSIAPVDSSRSLLFDRSQSGFEDVNAYFQVDRSQRYLQSLGYTGSRAIAPYPVSVDTHAANGSDTSFFVPSLRIGEGTVILGDGGTDDAEDADLVVHEYAHVIHEWIAPGTFLGPFASEGRAISEGFADYWGFSASYKTALQSGRDPFCFADWDARCGHDAPSENCAYPPTADCLRRLDSTKTLADFDRNESNGTQYANGEIWSSALREIFVAMTQRYGVDGGKRTADTLAIESLFGAPPDPGFAGIARRMIAADRYQTRGANVDVICAAMTRRGILSDCAPLPRGELTMFQSSERGVPIPDNDPNGVTLSSTITDSRPIDKVFVQVNIAHPNRGDLQISLIAPDGTTVNLQNQSNDRTANIVATFGRDSVPVDTLDVFHGRSEAGQWKLHVADVRPKDAGSILSWSLVIQFAGDAPQQTRPRSSPRQTIPVVGHVPGANGTLFMTDVRLENPTQKDVTAILIFTPSGADGTSNFAAVNVDIAAGHVVAISDVVGSMFGTAGIGQLEIDGEVVVSSRTYTTFPTGGTVGEIIPAGQGAGHGELIRLYNNNQYRTNIGFAETAGTGGHLIVSLIDATTGTLANLTHYDIAPYGHFQVAATAASSMILSFVSTTDVVAYASVVDSASGDAMFVPVESSKPRTGLAPALSASGANGTQWTTDVWVSVPFFVETPLPGAERLTYTQSSLRGGQTISVPWQREIKFPDIVSTTFNSPGTQGVITTPLGQSAAIKGTVINNGNLHESTSFLEALEDVQDIPFVDVSDAFRTNIGVMSDTNASVRVIVFDAAGHEIDSSVHDLGPNQLDQFGIPERVTNGFVRIVPLNGRIAAYASIVDNISGDGSFIAAEPVDIASAPR